MRTVKRNPFLAGLATILGGVLLVTSVASAELGSDKSGAILVFPKLVADDGMAAASTNPKDTIIQITNTSPHQISVRCFLVNANSHCSNAVSSSNVVCRDDTDCDTGGHCVPGWKETDFRFHLTGRQPIVWKLSEGLSSFPLNGLTTVGPVDNDPTLPAPLQGQPAFNVDSSIPPAPENPFIGELKCVQVDVATEQPTQGTDSDNNFVGDLAGTATIIEDLTKDDSLDARSYNAIGIQATPDAAGGDNTLVLGQEYDGCPNILILDHFFDDATEPVSNEQVRTQLTLVPCSEDFLTQQTTTTVVQYLVFNEFEQRFSTSNSVTCFSSIPLSDIASRPGLSDDAQSIFNVGVQGTLTGQTRIRPVDSGSQTHGDGLLGIAEEFHGSASSPLDCTNTACRSAAFNIHQTGIRSTPDIILLP
jgi:hypothetical protein